LRAAVSGIGAQFRRGRSSSLFPNTPQPGQILFPLLAIGSFTFEQSRRLFQYQGIGPARAAGFMPYRQIMMVDELMDQLTPGLSQGPFEPLLLW